MATLDRKKTLYLAAGIGLAFIAFRYRHKFLRPIRHISPLSPIIKPQPEIPFSDQVIKIVDNTVECQNVLGLLKQHINQFNVLGFDVEWVTVSGKRRPIALLQLSSHTGLCALFRLCKLRHMPKGLREILEDDQVIKVGIGTFDDASKLSIDYGIGVASTFDLRFLAAMTGHKAEGLGKLTKTILDIDLDKSWQVACSNWEVKVLTERQIHYSANDAYVAIAIFRKLLKELEPRKKWSLLTNERVSKEHIQRIEPFFDIRFKQTYLENVLSKTSERALALRNSLKATKTIQSQINGKGKIRGMCTRVNPMYDNCFLLAPDGELLCSIKRHKAEWYIDRNLGSVEPDTDTFMVRLNFEPVRRAVGDDGRYYQFPKENQCVVCGRRDAYIRKSVVPREYRKFFPVVLKSHTSHDVLLLCPNCHQLSDISDWKIRRELAVLCDAPLSKDETAVKVKENPKRKRLRSAARALTQSKNELPEERRKELSEVVLEHFNEKELTNEMLEEASNVATTDVNEDYRSHGERVVDCYKTNLGGLIELEKLWRTHFLNTMQPQYMPPFWSINHNISRLGLLAQEGRIDKQDLINAGLAHDDPRYKFAESDV